MDDAGAGSRIRESEEARNAKSRDGAWLLLAELSAHCPKAPSWHFLQVCLPSCRFPAWLQEISAARASQSPSRDPILFKKSEFLCSAILCRLPPTKAPGCVVGSVVSPEKPRERAELFEWLDAATSHRQCCIDVPGDRISAIGSRSAAG